MGAAPATRDARAWIARATVAAVFTLNVQCAAAFITDPGRYAAGFELDGIPGEAAVVGLGVAFLMWNATYPLVIWQPRRFTALHGVVVAQQAIGLVGEVWLHSALPAGHDVLGATLARFAVFDGLGLVLLLAAFVMIRTAPRVP